MQRTLDSAFSAHLKRLIDIVFMNFQQKKKTDDYELFLGKSGKNAILGTLEPVRATREWVTKVVPLALDHLAGFYEAENFENLMETVMQSMLSGGSGHMIERNIGFLG
jgi:hypothetical protein